MQISEQIQGKTCLVKIWALLGSHIYIFPARSQKGIQDFHPEPSWEWDTWSQNTRHFKPCEKQAVDSLAGSGKKSYILMIFSETQRDLSHRANPINFGPRESPGQLSFDRRCRGTGRLWLGGKEEAWLFLLKKTAWALEIRIMVMRKERKTRQ